MVKIDIALFKASFHQKSQAGSVCQDTACMLCSLKGYSSSINTKFPLQNSSVDWGEPVLSLFFCFNIYFLFSCSSWIALILFPFLAAAPPSNCPGTWTLLAAQKHHSLGLLGWNRLKYSLSLFGIFGTCPEHSLALYQSLFHAIYHSPIAVPNQPTLTFPKTGHFLHLCLRTLQLPVHFFQGARGYCSKLILNSVCNISLVNLHFSNPKAFCRFSF